MYQGQLADTGRQSDSEVDGGKRKMDRKESRRLPTPTAKRGTGSSAFIVGVVGLDMSCELTLQSVQARRGKRMTKEEAIYGYEDSDIEDEGRGRRGKKVR